MISEDGKFCTASKKERTEVTGTQTTASRSCCVSYRIHLVLDFSNSSISVDSMLVLTLGYFKEASEVRVLDVPFFGIVSSCAF